MRDEDEACLTNGGEADLFHRPDRDVVLAKDRRDRSQHSGSVRYIDRKVVLGP